jgi:hypothetical protein
VERRRLGEASDGALLELAALTLGQAAPDAEALVVHQCVLEAVVADLARQADLLGLPGRAALLGEERHGVRLRAQGAILPPELLALGLEEEQLCSHG